MLRELRRLGLIESQKGNRGGYRLVMPAQEITMLFLPPPQGAADRWLEEVAQRWSDELAVTTLQDLASLR